VDVGVLWIDSALQCWPPAASKDLLMRVQYFAVLYAVLCWCWCGRGKQYSVAGEYFTVEDSTLQYYEHESSILTCCTPIHHKGL